MQDLRLVRIDRHGRPAAASVDIDQDIETKVCVATVALYDRVGFVPPWVGYLALRAGDVVGTCAFKGPPVDGQAEIAYFTLPGEEGTGVATAMAAHLIGIARTEDASVTLVAHTEPREGASTTVLAGLGFVCEGPVTHPEDGPVWRWRLPPADKG